MLISHTNSSTRTCTIPITMYLRLSRLKYRYHSFRNTSETAYKSAYTSQTETKDTIHGTLCGGLLEGVEQTDSLTRSLGPHLRRLLLSESAEARLIGASDNGK